MTLLWGINSGELPTTDTTFEITDVSVFGGDTPKYAIIKGVGADATGADDSPQAGATLFYGFASQDQQFYTALASEDSQDPTDTVRAHETGEVGKIWSTNLANSCTMTLDSFIPNGIRLSGNWSGGTAIPATVVADLIGGTDVTGHVNTGLGPSVGSNFFNIGFKPNLVLSASCRNSSLTNQTDHAAISVGFGINDSINGTGSWGNNFYSQDADASAADVATRVSTSTYLYNTNTFDSFEGGHRFDNYVDSGFESAFHAGTATNQFFGFMALRFGTNETQSHNVWGGTFEVPATATETGYTGVGFTPQVIQAITHRSSSLDTDIDGPSTFNGSFSIGSANINTGFVISYGDQDGVGTSNTNSLKDTVIINQRRDTYDTTSQTKATLTSFDSDGWTFNYSAVDAGRLHLGLLIEEDGVIPPKEMSADSVGTSISNASFEVFRTASTNVVGETVVQAKIQVTKLATANAIGQAVVDLDIPTTLLTNLESYYKLDEDGTATRVDSFGSNDLTPSSTLSATSGKLNNACLFDGAAELRGGEIHVYTHISISGWVQIDSFDTFHVSWGRSSNTTDGYLMFRNGNELTVRMNDSVGTQTEAATTGSAFTAPGSYHIGFTWDGTPGGSQRVRIYVDGVQRGTQSVGTAGGMEAPNVDFKIGESGGFHWDNGYIDEVAIWSRTLTASEMSELYNEGVGIFYDNYIANDWDTAEGNTKSFATSVVGTSVVDSTILSTDVDPVATTKRRGSWLHPIGGLLALPDGSVDVEERAHTQWVYPGITPLYPISETSASVVGTSLISALYSLLKFSTADVVGQSVISSDATKFSQVIPHAQARARRGAWIHLVGGAPVLPLAPEVDTEDQSMTQWVYPENIPFIIVNVTSAVIGSTVTTMEWNSIEAANVVSIATSAVTLESNIIHGMSSTVIGESVISNDAERIPKFVEFVDTAIGRRGAWIHPVGGMVVYPNIAEEKEDRVASQWAYSNLIRSIALSSAVISGETISTVNAITLSKVSTNVIGTAVSLTQLPEGSLKQGFIQSIGVAASNVEFYKIFSTQTDIIGSAISRASFHKIFNMETEAIALAITSVNAKHIVGLSVNAIGTTVTSSTIAELPKPFQSSIVGESIANVNSSLTSLANSNTIGISVTDVSGSRIGFPDFATDIIGSSIVSAQLNKINALTSAVVGVASISNRFNNIVSMHVEAIGVSLINVTSIEAAEGIQSIAVANSISTAYIGRILQSQIIAIGTSELSASIKKIVPASIEIVSESIVNVSYDEVVPANADIVGQSIASNNSNKIVGFSTAVICSAVISGQAQTIAAMSAASVGVALSENAFDRVGFPTTSANVVSTTTVSLIANNIVRLKTDVIAESVSAATASAKASMSSNSVGSTIISARAKGFTAHFLEVSSFATSVATATASPIRTLAAGVIGDSLSAINQIRITRSMIIQTIGTSVISNVSELLVRTEVTGTTVSSVTINYTAITTSQVTSVSVSDVTIFIPPPPPVLPPFPGALVTNQLLLGAITDRVRRFPVTDIIE